MQSNYQTRVQRHFLCNTPEWGHRAAQEHENCSQCSLYSPSAATLTKKPSFEPLVELQQHNRAWKQQIAWNCHVTSPQINLFFYFSSIALLRGKTGNSGEFPLCFFPLLHWNVESAWPPSVNSFLIVSFSQGLDNIALPSHLLSP